MARGITVALLTVAASTQTAHAGGMPKLIGDEYVLVGLSVGYLDDGQSTGVYGIELSYNHKDQDVTWLGLYGDLRYDPTNEGALISFGGQIFLPFIGADVGPVLRLGRNGYGAGFRVRACVGLALVSVCGGGGWESVDQGFGEVTGLLKIPIELDS